MKIVFCIHTPAQVHLFRNIINSLIGDRHEIKILARDYGSTLELLNIYGFQYEIYIRHSNMMKSLKSLQIFPYVFNEYKLAKKFKPDLIIGIGTDEPLFASLLRKPCIIFNDSEPTTFQHLLDRIFSDVIITPSCFNKNLGKKHVRIDGYKELSYLHPNYFKPDPSIYDDLNIARDEKYIILRFNAFDAVHDISRHGFTVADQYKLVKELGRYAHVFISPERPLAKGLERYQLPISPEKIHHALYYAQMLVSDTGTMTTEAAILGTPSILCLSNVSKFGIWLELENKYDLIYSYSNSKQAIQKALELIQQPGLKQKWVEKRQKLLNDKIDVTKFMVEFIENYLDSTLKHKSKNNNQKRNYI